MAFKVIWSPQAIEDLGDLTGFIAQDNPAAATSVGLGILRKIASLAEHPQKGRIVPERKSPQIREIFHNPYRLVYRVRQRARTVELLRVWHAARGEPQL